MFHSQNAQLFITYFDALIAFIFPLINNAIFVFFPLKQSQTKSDRIKIMKWLEVILYFRLERSRKNK